jgi:hypothetical protein
MGVLQHALIGIDVLKVTGKVSSIGIDDVAGVWRAPIAATAVGDVAAVAAHEKASKEIDKGKEEGN